MGVIDRGLQDRAMAQVDAVEVAERHHRPQLGLERVEIANDSDRQTLPRPRRFHRGPARRSRGHPQRH